MNSSALKAKLKAARQAISEQNYERAADAARDVLAFESTNYNALVFLGLAQLHLDKPAESEQAYVRAIKSAPSQALAWQGLSNLYEKQQRTDKLVETLEELIRIFESADDAAKCAENVQKLIACRRSQGDVNKIVDALALLLPSSRLAPLLDTLPAPDPTAPTASPIHELQLQLQNTFVVLEEMIKLVEDDERKQIDAEVKRRRTRLTGRPMSAEATTKAVSCEVMATSRLPSLYEAALEHPSAPDTARRDAEAKLLSHLITLLTSIPSPFEPILESARSEVQIEEHRKALAEAASEKDRLRTRVEELVRGIVILKIPNQLAWRIALDWQDVASPETYDLGNLKTFCDVFAESSLAALIRAALYLAGQRPTLSDDDELDDKPPSPDVLRERNERAFDLIRDGFEQNQDSLVAHVLACRHYAVVAEHDSVIDLTESGLALVGRIEGDAGRRLPLIARQLQVWLATALTHLDPPLHHARAGRLLDSLLSDTPDDVGLLACRGYVAAGAERWADALAAFEAVLHQPAHPRLALEARTERSWALVNLGRNDEARTELSALLELPIEVWPDAATHARSWWRLGRCLWLIGGEFKTGPAHAYAAFVQALKIAPTFAPAFTSLGEFYLEAVTPPDHAQASKCLQKAFELDPREVGAAKLLVDEFAADRQWDLVEIVARRVLAGHAGGGRQPAERVTAGSVQARRLAWAWRAVGSADLQAERYDTATVAFQHALRGDATHAPTWIQLGQAYRRSGKHIAAVREALLRFGLTLAQLKTFSRVLQIDKSSWYARYCIADVQRSIGLLDPAVDTLERILIDRPDELGVQVVLAQTQLARARSLVRTGHLARAELGFLDALDRGLTLARARKASRVAIKVAADAMTDLAALETYGEPDRIEGQVERAVALAQDETIDARLPSPSVVTIAMVQQTRAECPSRWRAALAAVLLHKLHVLLETSTPSGAGAAWADLALSILALIPGLAHLDTELDETALRRSAIQCVRLALHREPRNPALWSALGAIALDLSPALAQHAFIRAAEQNSRSALPWTHLGVLYLTIGDRQLANQALLRAQVLDPEWSAAWLGQAALATNSGDFNEARALVDHAWMLSEGSLRECDLAFANSTFRQLPETAIDPASLAPSLFALTRFLATRPASDPTALLLHGLLAERAELAPVASTSLATAASALEVEYERTEAESIASRYIIANVNLGRNGLASGFWTGALDAFESALALMGEEAVLADEDARTGRSRIQALLGCGIAHAHQGAPDRAVHALELASAAAKASNDPVIGRHVVLVLARVLWAIGGDEQRAEARLQLLESVMEPESGLPHLPVISTLGAMAVVSADDELLDAALAEVIKLPIHQQLELDPEGDVPDLQAAQRLLESHAAGAMALSSRMAHARPSDTGPRTDLATLLLQSTEDRGEAARLLGLGADRSAVASVAAGERAFVDAKRAVRRAPWDVDTWRALAISCAA